MLASPWKFLRSLLCLLALSVVPAAAQPTELFISEYIEGSSINKAIEIYNGTGAAVNLAADVYNIQMFFNGNPSAGLTIDLTGTVADGDVFVLAHSAAVAEILAQADQTSGAGWFNGDDAVVLRKGATIIDSIGQAGFDPGSQWGSGLTSTADNTLRRKGTVIAGDTTRDDVFDPSVEWDGFATDTFDGLGAYTITPPPPPPPPPTLLEIHEIQGSGSASPYVGQRVETLDNIVTAKTSNGFFMQTPAARIDASDTTSEGIFVFTGAAPAVQVGDQVDVVGAVAEFFDLTEIANSPTVIVDSSGHARPAPVWFGPSVPSLNPPGDLERFEGMLVRVENALVTGPTDAFGDTAVVAGATRAFREPGIEYPGVPGYPTTWDGNPEIFEIDPNAAGLLAASFVAGAIIDVAEGPLSFAFGDYQIWPTMLTPGAQPDVLRPVRARVAGELTVGSQNMLRLFDTTNDPGVSDPVVLPEEFESRIAKASLYIRTVLGSPDVVVLEEVENLGVANALASRLATDDPGTSYTAYLMEGHDVGGIDIGMLVRSAIAVSSVTQLGHLEEFEFDGNTSFLHDRPPLVLQGNYVGNDAPFPVTVIGVHNRSLSGIEGNDGARVRAKRLAQALSIARYVQTIQESEPNRRLVLTGDFNAFQFSDGYVDALGVITGNLDPAGAILEGPDEVDPNLINQVNTLLPAEQYSYVFEGSAQVLDHTLTTANLQPFVRGFEYSRGNADAPASSRNDPSTPLALSDHDGAVLFVMTDRDADGLADDADSCPASSKTVVMVGACTTGVPDQILIDGCSITDSIAAMAAASANHGAFVSQTTHWLNELRKNGVIDNEQRGEIVSCAARANAP